MKIIFRLVLLIALVAAGVWFWTILFPRPEKVIRERLGALARTVSSSPNESDLARLAAAQSVAGFFATNVDLNLDLPGIGERPSVDREEIARAAYVGRSRPGGLKVTFPDIIVKLDPDKLSAVADVTVAVKIPGERDPVLQEMKFTLRKLDGRWLVTRVETVRVLY
jgi:hypothetical protein